MPYQRPVFTAPLSLAQVEAIRKKPIRPSFNGTYLTEEEVAALCTTVEVLLNNIDDLREQLQEMTEVARWETERADHWASR